MATNHEVQETLWEAVQVLESANQTAQVVLAASVLTYMRDYSASGNSIPVLRGLGLETAVALAQEIVQNGVGDLRIDTAHLARSLTMEPR